MGLFQEVNFSFWQARKVQIVSTKNQCFLHLQRICRWKWLFVLTTTTIKQFKNGVCQQLLKVTSKFKWKCCAIKTRHPTYRILHHSILSRPNFVHLSSVPHNLAQCIFSRKQLRTELFWLLVKIRTYLGCNALLPTFYVWRVLNNDEW